jgi:hypothetical protein
MNAGGPGAPLLAALHAEERALSLVAYRHQVCLLLIAAGDLAHLLPALDDLTESEAELALCGLQRAVAAAEAGGAWGLTPDATLAELATAAPEEGLGALLRTERDRLRHRVAEIGSQREIVQRLAAELLPVLTERQDRLVATFEAATYGPVPSR